MQARARFARCARNPLVECAKCRRECDLSGARATLCGDRACRVREMQARVRFSGCARNPLRRSCVSSARNAGESAICPVRAQPSAEIVRVECAKCRRECDFPDARATLCGDRACLVREMQARVRFSGCARNPLRRSCVSSARNAGESAIYTCKRTHILARSFTHATSFCNIHIPHEPLQGKQSLLMAMHALFTTLQPTSS